MHRQDGGHEAALASITAKAFVMPAQKEASDHHLGRFAGFGTVCAHWQHDRHCPKVDRNAD
jgi:hypothetical protein